MQIGGEDKSFPYRVRPYEKPFKLKKGIWKISCIVTDNAGNETGIMSGNDLSAECDWFLVEVSDVKTAP